MVEKKIKIRLNSIEKVEELLQESYDLACKHLNEIQLEINKLVNSTPLTNMSMDEKAKYTKAMHDYIGDQSKAVALKFEIVKFMGDIVKHNGDIEGAINDSVSSNKKSGLNFGDIRAQLSAENDAPKTYEIKDYGTK